MKNPQIFQRKDLDEKLAEKNTLCTRLARFSSFSDARKGTQCDLDEDVCLDPFSINLAIDYHHSKLLTCISA